MSFNWGEHRTAKISVISYVMLSCYNDIIKMNNKYQDIQFFWIWSETIKKCAMFLKSQQNIIHKTEKKIKIVFKISSIFWVSQRN